MQNRLKNVLRTGITGHVSPLAEKYILRSNFINLTIQVLVVLYGIFFYFLGAPTQALTMVAVFFLFLLVFFLNSRKYYTAAKIWQLLLLDACAYYYGISFGKGASVHYLFFVFITVPFLVFDIKQYISIFFCVACFMATFYIMEYAPSPMEAVLMPEAQEKLRAAVITLVLLWITANYLYYEKTNRLVENKLKENNRQLKLKNKELEQFAYIASHDLQEPLLTMKNFTGLLEAGYNEKLDDNGKKFLRYVSEASVRMSKLVSALMEYSRLGRERKMKQLDCNVIVDKVQDDLRASIEASGAEITHTELPVIKGYEVEMGQLFQNLISNAIKFRKADTAPRIHISALEENDTWIFAVQDNGIGIDPRFKEKIFVIFQRLHGRNEYEGTGIGLANCRKIVELHGGHIWVESAAGAGSTFYFTIPANL